MSREVFAVVPPRVEYRLTAFGESLSEPLTVLCRWTERHGARLEGVLARTTGKGRRR